MLTIIIGIVLAVVVTILMAMYVENVYGTVPGVIIILAILIACGWPHDYTEWQLEEEIELVSLSNSLASGGEGFIYVKLSSDNVYTYRYEVDSEFGTNTSKEYKTATLGSSSVVEVEDPNCETPALRIYEREAEKSWWGIRLFRYDRMFVFYVPEGTIAKEIKLS